MGDDPATAPRLRTVSILSPGNATDGFPSDIDDCSADALLAAWTALWHPSLLSATEGLPQVIWSESLPARLDNRCIVFPRRVAQSRWTFCGPGDSGSGDILPVASGEPLEAVRILGAHVCEVDGIPAAVSEQLASQWQVGLQGWSDEFILDLQALGYTLLQLERLSSLLQFTGHFDRSDFEQRLSQTRDLIRARDEAAARESLATCFAALLDSRHHFYPVDIYFLDWSLVPSGRHASLSSLPDEHPLRNLWLTGRQLRDLAAHDPSTLERLRNALDAGTFHLLGIEASELAWPLLPVDAAVQSVAGGIGAGLEHLGRRPAVFARRRGGMTPRVPLMLQQLGYQGVIHATLDEGIFPADSQPRTQWYGPDGSSMDALAAVPVDANGSAVFLRLASYLSRSIDRDYVATLCLANWIDAKTPWYRLLQRSCRIANVLGKFVSCQSYLQQTSAMGQHGQFELDDYRTPYLRQAVRKKQSDPVSRWPRLWQQLSFLEMAATWTTWSLACPSVSEQAVGCLHRSIQAAWDRVTSAEGDDVPIDVAELRDQAAGLLLGGLGSKRTPGDDRHLIFLNPTLRNLRPVPYVAATAVDSDAVYAVHPLADGRVQLTLDIPGGGFALLRRLESQRFPQTRDRNVRPGPTTPIVAEYTLTNDFIRVRIDPRSGGLAGFWLHGDATNRLSQRLVAVQPDQSSDDASDAASRMIADRISIEENSPLRGAIRSEGRIVNEMNEPVVEFQQWFQLWRGMRYVSLRIHLRPVRLPRGTPWSDYVASRVRWPQRARKVRCVAHDMLLTTRSPRFDAPLGYQVLDDQHHTSVWTRGLPFHRRTSDDQCDTLLLTAGESARDFEVAFAANPVSPRADAGNILQSPHGYAVEVGAASRGWLFHCDARHVLASHWRPLWQDGKAVGVAVRLAETADRGVIARLRCARPWQAGCKTDFLGTVQSQCPVDAGVVQIAMAPREWTDLYCYW